MPTSADKSEKQKTLSIDKKKKHTTKAGDKNVININFECFPIRSWGALGRKCRLNDLHPTDRTNNDAALRVEC